MDLYLFLNKGIENITSTVSSFYIRNIKGFSFIGPFVSELKKAAKIREKYELEGTHIPPFLIASIASDCNLRCKGCYARAQGMCDDDIHRDELNISDWERIFCEAANIGVSFILLAGGEPLIKREVIEAAAKIKNIAFPIFTNGTLIDNEYIKLFDKHRNLIPVFSIEGEAIQTDLRRGKGVSKKIESAMNELNKRKILFATSITLTSENFDTVTSLEFAQKWMRNFVLHRVCSDKRQHHNACAY